MTAAGRSPYSRQKEKETVMAEDTKGSNLVRLAVGAGLLATVAVGVAVLVPRRRWASAAAPLRAALDLPVAVAVTGWLAGLWDDFTAPTPPIFDDLRPFDEF